MVAEPPHPIALHHEYALEPAAVQDWRDLRSWASLVGWEHGRLLSDLPDGKWLAELKLVLERHPAGLDGKRGEALLAQWRTQPHLRFVRRKLKQPSREGWAQSVARAEQTRQFHQVVSAGDQADLPLEALANDVPPLLRAPEQVAEALVLLLQSSSRIRLVDPYFNPTRSRYLKALSLLLRRATWQGTYRRTSGDDHLQIIIETCPPNEADRSTDRAICQQWCQLPALRAAVPAPHLVQLRFWRDKDLADPKPVFHNRYLLTDRGGVIFPHGLDFGADDQRELHDDITRMTASQWVAREADFNASPTAYEKVAEGQIWGKV